MYTPQKLNDYQISLCKRTIGANPFYLIVADAIVTGKPLSVVRMADGERLLWNMAVVLKHNSDLLKPNASLSQEWFDKMGVTGINKEEFLSRIMAAGSCCTYAAPSISGVVMNNYNTYDMYPEDLPIVDNFFPNAWFRDMRENLFKASGKVAFVHGNVEMASKMKANALQRLGVEVEHFPLSHWTMAGDVIDNVAASDCKLVIYSSGPASKHIGPAIVGTSKTAKVALDVGQAAHKFLFDWY